MVDWLKVLNPQYDTKNKTNQELEKEIKDAICTNGILGIEFLTKLHIDSQMLR